MPGAWNGTQCIEENDVIVHELYRAQSIILHTMSNVDHRVVHQQRHLTPPELRGNGKFPMYNSPSDISPYPARLGSKLGVGLARLGLGLGEGKCPGGCPTLELRYDEFLAGRNDGTRRFCAMCYFTSENDLKFYFKFFFVTTDFNSTLNPSIHRFILFRKQDSQEHEIISSIITQYSNVRTRNACSTIQSFHLIKINYQFKR